jgi:glycosyltransferase involved in cell wall biosynthesis
MRAIPNPMPVDSGGPAWSVRDADPDQILFVGRFDLCKGADVAIRAFARALEWRPSLTLLMAGPDRGLAQPDGRTLHFDEFVAREISPEARARIRFLGSQPPQRIAELRLRSCFALVASRFENFAYSIGEAMAVGMPVLASDTFGSREMIRDGLDGRIVPSGDSSAMAEGVLAMASDPEGLAKMGRTAYERVAAWLSPERVARDTVNLYHEVIAKPHTGFD